MPPRTPSIRAIRPLLLLLARSTVSLASPFLKHSRITLSGHPGGEVGTHHEPPKPGSAEFCCKLGVSVVLVLLGGVFAGYVAIHLLLLSMPTIITAITLQTDTGANGSRRPASSRSVHVI